MQQPALDVDLLIFARSAVTMNASRSIIENGAVAVHRGAIVGVGTSAEIREKFRAEKIIDAPWGLLTPGLIDAHNHPVDHLIKGLLDDLPQMRRLRERVLPYEDQLDDECARAASLATFAEMIRHGTTCFADGAGPRPDAVASAALEVGIRGVVAYKGADLAGPFGGTPVEAARVLETADRTVERFEGAGGGMLRARYSLDFPPTASDQLVTETCARACRNGVGVVGHLIGVKPAHASQAARNSDLERYSRLGVLGPDLLLAHVGWASPADVALLVDSGTQVVHCPSSSFLGGNGWVTHGVIPELIAAGANVVLGTDAAIISRSLDMVRVMYLAGCAHKDVRRDPLLVGAHRAFEMATIDAARALQWERQIGSIEVGKAADLVLFDVSGPQWWPNRARNPVPDLVYSASGSDVRTVVINGRVVMEDGLFTTIDQEQLCERVDRAAARALTQLGLKPSRGWPTRTART